MYGHGGSVIPRGSRYRIAESSIIYLVESYSRSAMMRMKIRMRQLEPGMYRYRVCATLLHLNDLIRRQIRASYGILDRTPIRKYGYTSEVLT